MSKKYFIFQRYSKFANEWINLKLSRTQKTAINLLNTYKAKNPDIDYRVVVYDRDDYFYGDCTIIEVIK